MKKLMNKRHLLTLFLLALVAWRQLPLMWQNFQSEGINIPPQTYPVIASKDLTTQRDFPSSEERAVILFWATWCGPCKIDMKRLQASVEAGKIKPHQIVAISPFENPITIKKFLKDNPYDFTFIHAPNIASTLNIEVTPTTAFIDKGVVRSLSSGLSLIGIWRAEFFLK